MYKEIVLQLADGSEKSVPFVANGATSLRYRMVFGQELMTSITNLLNIIGIENLSGMMKTAQALEEKGQNEMSLDNLTSDQMEAILSAIGAGGIDTIKQLAFIMNASAERKDMRNLDIDSYVDWLEQFEAMELLMHSMDFIGLYMSNRITTSTPKKKDDRLIDQ